MSALNECSNGNEEEWKDEDFLSFGKTTLPAGAEDGSDMEFSTGTPPSEENNTKKRRVDTDLPPWMDRPHDRRRVHSLTALHNEIVSFCRLMEPLPEEIKQREVLSKRVKELIEKAFEGQSEKIEVKVFGSQATGLFLPDSDIDLVVLKVNSDSKNGSHARDEGDEEQQKLALATVSPLQRVASALREHWISELSYLEVIENTRVPLVKFTHGPTNVSVDISFDQENGPRAAQLMKTYLNALPPLRPLAFVLKYFLAARELNVPYTGGVGSFMLQLMIVAFLQHRERDAVNYNRPAVNNLGSMLIEFLELYGVGFNYYTTGISVRLDGFFFPKGAISCRDVFYNSRRPFSCAIENPLDPSLDVGSASFRVQIVQRAFAVAYRMLIAHVAEPVLPTNSILATILDPTSEMVQRKWHHRRNQPLSAPRGRDDRKNAVTSSTSSNNMQQRKRRRQTS